jgi:MFS family permease
MGGIDTAVRTLRAALGTSAMRRVLLGFLGFAITELAAWVAILLVAYAKGGATAAGAIAVAQLVPAVFTGPLGSTMSERMDRRRALTVAYGVLAASMVGLWLTLELDAPVWLFTACAIASNCAVTLGRPAHYSALPRFASSAGELVAANSASSTMENLGLFIGPGLLAVMIPVVGVDWLFAVLAGVAAMAAAGVWGIHVPAEVTAPTADESGLEPAGFISDALAGIRELRATSGATVLLVLVGVQFVIVGMLDVLAIVFPQQALGLGEASASAMVSATGIGGLVGAAATVVLVGRRRMTSPLLGGFVGTGVFLASVSVSQTLAVAAALVAAASFARAFIDVAGRTLLQRNARDEVLARVFGVQESVLMAGLAVGSLIAPIAVNTFGARSAFVVAGFLPAALALAAWPALRRLDRHAVLPGPEFEVLRGVSIFRPLPQARLELLAQAARSIDLPAGHVVIRQGDEGADFYVVVNGETTVLRDDVEVNRHGPGGSFGEVALLHDLPRNATIITATPTRLLVIARDDFLTAVAGSTLAKEEALRVAAARRFPDDTGNAHNTDQADD